jgi:hypothetical protein
MKLGRALCPVSTTEDIDVEADSGSVIEGIEYVIEEPAMTD